MERKGQDFSQFLWTALNSTIGRVSVRTKDTLLLYDECVCASAVVVGVGHSMRWGYGLFERVVRRVHLH